MRYLLYIIFILIPALVMGQNRNVDTTIFEYKDKGKFPVANSYKIPDAPVMSDTGRVIPEMKYSIVSKPAYPVVYLVPIPAAKLEGGGEKLKKLYSSYLVAGMGTYTTPLFSYRYNSLRSKTSSFGLHLRHISSVFWFKDHGWAGWSDDLAEGHMKYFLSRHSLTGGLGYTRNGLHYYGYDANTFAIDDNTYTKQVFHHFSSHLTLQSHYPDSSKLNHKITARINSMVDFYKTRETDIFLETEMGTQLNGEYAGGIFKLDYLNDKLDFSDTNNSIIVSLSPYIKFLGRKFRANLSGTLAADFSARNRFYIYPNFEVSYNVANYIFVPYGGIGGSLERNTYKSLSDENPFINPLSAFSLRNKDMKELYAGMRGSLSNSVGYHARAAIRWVRDEHFFVTDTVVGVPDLFELMENRFVVVYDTGTNVRLNGELKFSKNEKFYFLLKGEYNSWKLRNQPYAWHKPALKLSGTIHYSIADKIVTDLDVFYYSRQLASVSKSKDAEGVTELKGYADVNLRTEYNYNKRFSVFLNVYNIGSVRYYKWLNYPSQRIQFLGGVKLSF